MLTYWLILVDLRTPSTCLYFTTSRGQDGFSQDSTGSLLFMSSVASTRTWVFPKKSIFKLFYPHATAYAGYRAKHMTPGGGDIIPIRTRPEAWREAEKARCQKWWGGGASGYKLIKHLRSSVQMVIYLDMCRKSCWKGSD